ncbi:Fic-domain-containing protein [Trametes sanguinea]|nr:Fic-domain-containing protein [Trametes sanguinea]
MVRVEDGLKGGLPAYQWFPAIQRLLRAFPAWAWANFRFAYAALYLEDLQTAVEYFGKARALVKNADAVFDEWFASFKAYVEKESSKEDELWSNPEDGTIVQLFKPPMDLDAFLHGTAQIAGDIVAEWEALHEYLTPDVSVKRYARLHAIETNELEDVFSLGGDSLPRIIRVGFFSAAIDRVRHGPPGGVQSIVEILKDVNRGLSYLSGAILPTNTITQENILTIHREVMKSSQIGYVHCDGEEVAYLNTIGAYRRRLVTINLTRPDASDDGPAKIVQFARHQEIEQHMDNFLVMVNRQLATVQLDRADPAAFSLAAWIHYNLAVIHPFTDGNGRVCRIVSSLPLLKAGFPPMNIRHSQKAKYLETLRIANSAADLRPLTNLIASEMRESIRYLHSLPPPSPEDSQWRMNVTDGETRIVL